MRGLLRRWGGSVLAVLLVAGAAFAIHRELAPYHVREIAGALRAIGPRELAAAVLLTLLSYAALTVPDALALRRIGRPLPYRTVALLSFTASAFSQNVGLAALTGASVRYRLYTALGLAPAEVAAVVSITSLSFWLGLFGAGGLVLTLQPAAVPAGWPLPFATLRPLGVLFLGLVAAYALYVVRRRAASIEVFGQVLPLPGRTASLVQVAAATLDWVLASGVLYVLLPGAGAPGTSAVRRFLGFAAIFMLAQIAGLLSQIPGGLGVFEGVVLVLGAGGPPGAQTAAALIAYRLVYYLGPLLAAALLFAARELTLRWPVFGRAPRVVGRGLAGALPSLLTLITFVAGVVLLVSGATPEIAERMEFLRGVLPLPVVELSHFLASLAGALLLLVARGLQLRLDGAWLATAVLLAAGAAFSVVKGLDVEEALALLLVLAVLLPSRRHFYRRASLLAESFTPAWVAAVVLVLGLTAWLAAFSHRHTEFARELWWEFAFSHDAPRSLRATVGAVVLVLVFAGARLLRPARPAAARPDPDALDRARPLVEQSRDTLAWLTLCGDKALCWSPGGRALVSFAVEGRSFVALGDPVGHEPDAPEAAWTFHELADRHGGWTVFYQVAARRLPIYLDMGLAVAKLGEEARVPLAGFTLEGGAAKSRRHVLNTHRGGGSVFEVVPPGAAALIPELRRVSDAWLAHKNTREKRFSLGFFDAEYLLRCPLALVRRGGAIVAFANLWPGGEREELSVDLMRYGADAPDNTMDYLFLETMLWGRREGYAWFNLGMAPLSGIEPHPRGPLWAKLGAYLYRHGEHFYNFRGLRQYKEKFDPVWQPRYLAYPGGLTLAPILVNLVTLTSGGLKGAVTR